MTRLHLTLFGAPALSWQGAALDPPPPKALALLAYLTLRDAPCERRDLSELLWETTSSGSLRVALSTLRTLPGADSWLQTDGQLVRATVPSDVAGFERAAREERWSDALELWPPAAGPLLAGFALKRAGPFTSWLEEQRTRLDAARVRAHAGRLEQLEAAGETTAALALARELLAADGLDEAAHRAVMRLEHGRGDTAAALAQFEALRARLRHELDVEPLPETLDLLALIEAGDDRLGGRARLLRAADEVSERPLRWVGRAALLERVHARLEQGAQLLLHGIGGAGKSALAAEAAARWLAPGGRSALWIETGRADPDALFDAAADALGARRELSRAGAAGGALCSLLQRAGIGLVVLDDVWSGYALARFAEVLPPGAALLASARQRYPLPERIDVGRLERGAAVELLGIHAGRTLIGDGQADALCELLGDHPFALRVAGVALAARRGDPAATALLIERIVTAPHTLALPDELAEPGRASVAALLEVSLAELSDAAYEALMGIGALYTPSSTPELLARLLRREVDAAEAALGELLRAALAERLAEPGRDGVRYRLHDLTFSLARANSHLREGSVRRASMACLAERERDFEALDADIGNLLAAVERERDDPTVSGDTGAFVDAVCRLAVGGGYFSARGHTPASLALLESAAEAARERGDAGAAGALLARLGDHARESAGDSVAALERYEEACTLARAAGEREREAVLTSLTGAVRFELGRDGADERLARALELARESGDRLALAHALQNLSYVAGVRGDFEAAASHSAAAVEATEGLRDRIDDPAEADHKRFFALHNLAVATWRLGDAEAALATLERALAFAEERDNELWRAWAHQELGDLHHDSGRREAAAASYRAAFDLYRRNRVRQDAEALVRSMVERGYSVPSEVGDATPVGRPTARSPS